jgi:hypothetical protein
VMLIRGIVILGLTVILGFTVILGLDPRIG